MATLARHVMTAAPKTVSPSMDVYDVVASVSLGDLALASASKRMVSEGAR